MSADLPSLSIAHDDSDSPGRIRFTSRPTASDVALNAAAFSRRSGGSIAIGTFASATSAIAIVVMGDLFSIVLLLFGLSILSGLFVVPFVWLSIRRRRDLVLAPLDIDADQEGISVASAIASSHQGWSVYREAVETSRAFLLNTGAGAAVLLAKRGMTSEQIVGFRALLAQVGLLRPPLQGIKRLRPLVWVAVGLAATAAAVALPIVLSVAGRTATIDLVASQSGHTVIVKGSTDLPDGAIVDIELIGPDAGQPDQAVLTEQPSVAGGFFDATFDVTGWPAGRAEVTAYFWVDEGQPSAVIDRFGADGAGLQGPNVYRDAGYPPTLIISQSLDLVDG